MRNMLLCVLMIVGFAWLSGCATTRPPMVWVSVTQPTNDNYKQDNYQCQHEAGVFSGAYSQTGTISTSATRNSTYQVRFKQCMESKGYSLEDKEMFDNKQADINKLSNECPAKIGTIASTADIAPPKILEMNPEGAAARAGLAKGDIVKTINGIQVNSSVQFLRLIFITIKPGVPVDFSVTRNGFSKTFTVIPDKK